MHVSEISKKQKVRARPFSELNVDNNKRFAIIMNPRSFFNFENNFYYSQVVVVNHSLLYFPLDIWKPGVVENLPYEKAMEARWKIWI